MQTVIVALLLLCMLVATVAVNPDWVVILHGSLVPNLPDFKPWVRECSRSSRFAGGFASSNRVDGSVMQGQSFDGLKCLARNSSVLLLDQACGPSKKSASIRLGTPSNV